MNASAYGRSPFRSPVHPGTSQARPHQQLQRVNSSSSSSSTSSQVTVERNFEESGRQGVQQSPRQTGDAHEGGSGKGLPNFSKPSASRIQVNEPNAGVRLPVGAPGQGGQHHQAPQHAQGFFEPTLPTTSSSNQTYAANLTASQIAAQAAMQLQSFQQHARKRSQTVPNSQQLAEGPTSGPQENPPSPRRNGSLAPFGSATGTLRGPQYHNGSAGGNMNVAASAANAAYPRSALSSPGLPSPDLGPVGLDKDPKHKVEKSRLKLFSKPKAIGISRDRDMDKKDKALPSPSRMGVFGPSPFPRMVNASTTSLADSVASTAPSTLYGMSNASASTLVPSAEGSMTTEKHKHHFLSRQKHKLKDKDDHHHFSLSSTSSNTKNAEQGAPQPLYSFNPSSPGYSSTSFSKSVSGLDLRHGGRALREKKREEKASAAANAAVASNAGLGLREEDPLSQPSDWPGSLSIGLGSGLTSSGPPKAGSFSVGGGVQTGYLDALGQINLQGLGLVGMTPDDAWPYLKAKLLILFEGEDLRSPVEDFNKAHLQRCIHARAPYIIIDDLQDLLHTGFSSLNHTLRRNSEERLVPSLVDLWLAVFGTILPQMQAVFLPLDLEFRGTGSIMGPRDAQAFWAALPDGSTHVPLADTLDVRRIVLVAFRDTVILSRYDILQAVFSRLSLESINGISERLSSSPDSNSGEWTGTAANLEPGVGSYNSQGSTLLNDSGAALDGARSRATSNTSSARGRTSFSSTTDPIPSPPAHIVPAPNSRPPASTLDDPANSARVTETVGRMLQCVSVLASIRSADEAQKKMEKLAKTLKHNWLGRGRTGRNRKGFVGTKVSGPSIRTGSPTPTPSTMTTDGGQRGSTVKL